jgi:subtilase family serine protease
VRRIACLVAITALAAAGVTVGTAGAAAGRTKLAGSVPSWATAAHRVGATNGATKVGFRVYLPWRGGGEAAALAQSVSTPGRAASGHFLSPAEFRSRFSPTAKDTGAVTNWLRGQGFAIGTTPANRHYVEAVGTVAQAAAAFDTSFANYSYSGATLRAPQRELSVPAGLPAISAVVGLDESAVLIRPEAKPGATPPGAFVNGRPCSAYWGEKTVASDPALDGTALPASPPDWAPCGYAGAQLQGAYGLSGAIGRGNNGSGVTVAVIDAYASPTIVTDVNTYSSRHGPPTIVSDIETYSAAHGLPSTNGLFHQIVAPGIFLRPQNPAQNPQGWSGEETLDIEAVHTMAPGASIVYVAAPNNYADLDSALNHVVDRHLADIVTNSYGFSTEALPPGYIKPFNDTLIQAAAEGISVLFSSGDNGDETGGNPAVAPTPDWPASSPWVTAVGGTSLGVNSANGRQFELGWETTRASLDGGAWGTPSYLYGSGGGTSRIFAQPSYQAGVVPDAIAKRYGGPAMRVVPDVAAVGDPTTGMLVGQTQRFPDGTDRYSEFRLGGTSLSSPLFAGMLALAEQNRGSSFGLANPALYAAAGTSAYNDITKAALSTYIGAVRSDYVNGVDPSDGYVYTARYFDQDDALTIHVAPGYDDVTGVGSPNGDAWLAALD